MTLQDNKRLARRFYEDVLNTGKLELLDDVLSDNFIDHPPSGEGVPGIPSFREFVKMVAGAFPDLRIQVNDVLAEGSKVAVRLTVHGTHQGVLMGEIEPSGKDAMWTGIDILEIESDKITARWSERDLLGMMRQIGAIE
jgi:predicted ester cyclase